METVAGYSIREQFLALQNWSTQNTGENEVKMFSAQRNGLFCVATFAPISSCINLSKVVALNVTRPILTSAELMPKLRHPSELETYNKRMLRLILTDLSPSKNTPEHHGF